MKTGRTSRPLRLLHGVWQKLAAKLSYDAWTPFLTLLAEASSAMSDDVACQEYQRDRTWHDSNWKGAAALASVPFDTRVVEGRVAAVRRFIAVYKKRKWIEVRGEGDGREVIRRPDPKRTLAADEAERRRQLEDELRDHKEGRYATLGAALREIRDGRLYRSTHKTFESYCVQVWQWRRDYVNKLIRASAVNHNLDTKVSKPPTERIARPLTELPPDEQRDAWQEVLDAVPPEQIKAKDVRKVVNRRKAKRKAPAGYHYEEPAEPEWMTWANDVDKQARRQPAEARRELMRRWADLDKQT